MQVLDTIESIMFMIFYLVIIWVFLIRLIITNYKNDTFRNRERYWQWTFLAYFLLGFGDIFHLGLRVVIFIAGWGPDDHLTNLSIASGTILTSLTMYYFYVAVFHLWANLYGLIHSTKSKIKIYTVIEYSAYFIGVILLFMPYNRWYEGNGTVDFGFDFRIITAIPLYILGLIAVGLLLRSSRKERNTSSGKVNIEMNRGNYLASWWFIVSFITYSLTIFFVANYPIAGMFMIPKTIAYLVAFYYHYRNILTNPLSLKH